MGLTIFDTFRLISKNSEGFGNGTSFTEIDSILEHLRNVLNTRQGSVQIAENYGMPDLTNFPGENLSASVLELEKIIKTTIERYEPRLVNIKVNYSPVSSDNLTLKFGLSAEIIAGFGEKRQAIFFETIITSDGMVMVYR